MEASLTTLRWPPRVCVSSFAAATRFEAVCSPPRVDGPAGAEGCPRRRCACRRLHALRLNPLAISEGAAIEVVDTNIALDRLREMTELFGDLVKAVVDVERRVMVVHAQMHSDEEALLLDLGSRQEDLWGINLYPDEFGSNEWIEFDSMINMRPRQENRSRSVEDASVRARIVQIVRELVVP